MTNPVVLAPTLWLAALVVTIACWWVRHLPRSPRALILFAVGLAILLMPLLLPESMFLLRAGTAIFSLMFPLKLFDLHLRGERWRNLTFKRYLFYIVQQVKFVERQLGKDPEFSTGANLLLLARGILEIGAGLALLHWAHSASLGEISFWLEHTVIVIGIYLVLFDGSLFTMGAVWRLTGYPFGHVCIHPIVARSPADFWRRYNRPTGQFFYENVFKPLGGLRHPLRGIFLVFFINGLVHEYIVWIGTGVNNGYMMLFFMVQAVGVALTFRARPKGWKAVVSWALTVLFILGSTVFFLVSFDGALPIYSHGHPLPPSLIN